MRSPYPQYDLRKVISYLFINKTKVNGTSRYSREDLSEIFGFARVSGMGQTVISSMVHYGLLNNLNGHYVFTDEAIELIADDTGVPRLEEILKDLLIRPTIFNFLHTKQGIVRQDELINKYGLKADKVGKAFVNYRNSVKFVDSTIASMHENETKETSLTSTAATVNVGMVKIDLGDGKIVELPKEIIANAIQSKVDELDHIRQQILSS